MSRTALVGAAVAALLVGATSVGAQAGPNGSAPDTAASGDRGASYWTPARRAAAQPRDLVVDQRGLGYLQRADGTLEPYGHSVAAANESLRVTAPAGSAQPKAGPPSDGDGSGPLVENVDPVDGDTIGAAHDFRATVSDDDGIKSVDFVLSNGSSSWTDSASRIGMTNEFGIDYSGFTDGEWTWTIVARDNAKRGGSTTEKSISFNVDTGETPPVSTEPPPTTATTTLPGSCDDGTSDVVNERWTCGGEVRTAAGRIYFEMPANRGGSRWNGYVCSGTVVEDGNDGISIILTAAHCVYDDVYGVFARNVLFIPDQDGTSGAGTDRNCINDPLGCWEPSHGVVDGGWTASRFPDNIPYDYAYYVVSDDDLDRDGNVDAHTGADGRGPLDVAAGALPIHFGDPEIDSRALALGYSYSDDPNFMYCAEKLGTEASYGDYWLGSCGLSGGASGGPWIQPMDTSTGSGSIISVNSWGYRDSPGMGGPPLTTTAECVFTAAQNETPVNTGGIIATCP